MTDHTPPTDQELDAIEARAGAATPGPWRRPLNTRYKHTVTAPLPDDERGSYLDGIDPVTGEREQCTVAAIPIWSNGKHSRQRGGRDLEYIAAMHPEMAKTLVAEVRRLRARVGELEARHLPKLCECGHTRLVHTVPAPHGCFAGKIKGAEPCDCGEYRQLSFAEAERRIAERHAARAEQRAAAEETHVIADDSDDPEHVDDCPGCQPQADDQTATDRAILKAAPESSDDWDDATWAAWWRTAERVHGDRPAVRPAVETGARPACR